MTFSSFIRANTEEILQGWEEFARSIHSARHMDPSELRDDAKNILLAIADDLEQAQSKEAQKEKSEGRQTESKHSAAATHGLERQSGGFSITETVSEFRALRASVTNLWKRQAETVSQDQVEELIRFNEAIDQAVNVSVTFYSKEKERLTTLFDNLSRASPDATYVLDHRCRFLYVNRAMERLYGLPREKFIGELACHSESPLDVELQEQIVRVMASGQSFHGELSHAVAGGDQRAEYSIIPILGKDYKIEASVGVLHDVTERKRAEDRIWHYANHDLLTGLPNRRLFFDRLQQEIEHSRRSGLPLAVLYIDLNNFKEVNDRFGHQFGDQLLRDVANHLNKCIRKADTVARIGGDEFTVLLTDLQDTHDVHAVAEKISEALDMGFEIDGEPFRVSASIGIALYPKDASSPEDLLKDADRAMYQAKSSVHHHICFFDPASSGIPPH